MQEDLCTPIHSSNSSAKPSNQPSRHRPPIIRHPVTAASRRAVGSCRYAHSSSVALVPMCFMTEQGSLGCFSVSCNSTKNFTTAQPPAGQENFLPAIGKPCTKYQRKGNSSAMRGAVLWCHTINICTFSEPACRIVSARLPCQKRPSHQTMHMRLFISETHLTM